MHALRKYLHCLIMEPSSSKLAMGVAVARNISIIVSSLNAIYTTFPHYRVMLSGSAHWQGPRGSHAIEAACALWFTVEAMMQILATQSICALLKRTSFAVNFLSVFSWFMRLAGVGNSRVVSILRLLQTPRTLLLLPNSKHYMRLMITTSRRAALMLALLSCLMCIRTCLLAVVLWTVERGEWDPNSRMFLRRTGWSCPMTCQGPAWFGAYSGCTAAGEEFWLSSRDKIGRQQHLCVPVLVCLNNLYSIQYLFYTCILQFAFAFV
jgi:hypothetical protein